MKEKKRKRVREGKKVAAFKVGVAVKSEGGWVALRVVVDLKKCISQEGV